MAELDAYRRRDDEVLRIYGSFGDETCGAFMVPFPATGATLRCIASSETGWDHVSVSLPNRTPNWFEMQHIHRTFFREGEIAWEYHVPPDKHINRMPFCLHLWRKHGFEMPLPPSEFV